MLSEHLPNCFRLSLNNSLIEVFTHEEMLREIEKINKANEQIDNFLSGNISKDDFLSFIEQYTPVDQYIQNVDDNLASWIGNWD